MENKKIPTGVGAIVITIILVTVGILVWKINKDYSANLNSHSLSDNSKGENDVKISDKWLVVSHGNFWNNPNLFTNRNYKFSNIKFSYPENWEFRCCGDMDYASEHFINPPSREKPSPYIRITDYVLNGCPDLKNDCAIDEIITLTASEKFNWLKSNVSSGKALPEKELKKLNTKAFVYDKTEKNGSFSKAYLINIKDAVIQIDFVNYDLLDEKFIENFLNRIELESK